MLSTAGATPSQSNLGFVIAPSVSALAAARYATATDQRRALVVPSHDWHKNGAVKDAIIRPKSVKPNGNQSELPPQWM